MSTSTLDPSAFIDALAAHRAAAREQISVLADAIAAVEARTACAPTEKKTMQAELAERAATIEDLERLLEVVQGDLAAARRKYRLTTTAAERIAIDEAYAIEQERREEAARAAERKAAKLEEEHDEPSDEGSTVQ